jgi:hypothetical protein
MHGNFFLILVLSIVISTASSPPAQAQQPQMTFVSTTGSDSNPGCTATQPCASLTAAAAAVSAGGKVVCLSTPSAPEGLIVLSQSVTIDCAGTFLARLGGLTLQGTNQNVIIRNLTFDGTFLASAASAIQFTGSGSLILQNCGFANFLFAAVVMTPNSPSSLVVTNTQLSSNGAGLVIKPASGGQVSAVLVRDTIVRNNGGGVKADATNGNVAVDIIESLIGDNAGNGVNAVGGAGQDMVSIKNTVIARNGAAGIQSNGANAGVLVATTVLDQNAAGATSVINGGHLLTYGDNNIIGSIGSGFTATAQLY